MDEQVKKKLMMNFRKKKLTVRKNVFSKRYLTKESIIASILGICSFILLLVLISDTLLSTGELGILGFALSFAGLLLSVKSLNIEKSDEKIGRISAILNFIPLLLYFILYMYGLFISF